MSELVTFKINDREVTVEKGTLLIEAAKKAGVGIPHFCYHPRLKPDANCRMCLVEIEKVPKLQTSCTTPVTEGMVVRTDSKSVIDSQNGVMEYLLGNHPLDCPECDQGGECQLQDFGHQYSPEGSRFVENKRVFPKEYFGPLVEKEMNRCVSCLRCVRYCDEVMDVKALGSFDRGNGTQIGTFAHGELVCEYCGGCIQICPVGALTSRLSMFDNRTWQLKKTDSICNYCGDGCTLTLEGVKTKVSRVSSETGVGRNNGDLCVRGFFGFGAINHKDRLTRPLLLLEGGKLEVTWEWAYQSASDRLKAIVEKYGAASVGGIISAQCSNEEVYLFQKLMREVIGTPNIDSTARYGFINAVRALNDVFGTARLARYEDVIDADVLLVFAGEMTETNPVASLKVKEAVRQKKAKLITISPYSENTESYFTHLPSIASCHLQIKVGTEQVAVLGLTKAVLEGNPASSVPGVLFEKMKTAAASISFEAVEAATGVSEQQFRDAGALYADAKRGVMIVGRSVLRAADGYQSMLRLSELSLLAGQVRNSGGGILCLAKESNAFGAIEMGGVPEYLPGFKTVANQEKGKTLLEMIDAAAEGKIKALYFVGENPLRTLPQKKVAAALENVELLICQDLYANELTDLAHIVFPGTSYAEKSGHFTNQEGEIQKGHEAIEPVGSAKPDWQIFSALIGKMRAKEPAPYQELLAHKSSDVVWKELVMAMPAPWPLPANGDLSSKVISYAELATIKWGFPEKSKDDGDFDLIVGQSLYHAGKMSTYASGLTDLQDKTELLMNPEDGEALGLEEGELVELSSRNNGNPLQLPVKFSQKLAVGTLFVPEHFSLAVKKLLPLTLDPSTSVPCGDRGRVSLAKVSVTAS